MMGQKSLDDNKKKGEVEERFSKAKTDLKKMQEEIAPFIKKRTWKEVSLAEEWINTSLLNNCDPQGT